MRNDLSTSSRRSSLTTPLAWRGLAAGLAGTLALTTAAMAQTTAVPDSEAAPVAGQPAADTYRDYTPAQIAALPDAVRLDQVPMRYIFAAQGYEDPEGFELVHSMKLQALMYDTTRSFDAAVRDFQGDLGEDRTGILTVSQIAELTYRNGLLKLGRVELLNAVKVHAFEEEFATAQGTWSAVSDTTLLPLNESSIRCDQARAVCEEATTYVAIPGRDSWDMAYLVLNTHDTYEVTRWRRQSIEALRLAGCRQVLLTLGRDGAVTRRPGELLPEDQCSLILGEQAEAAPDLLQTVELVSGTDIIRTQYQELQALAFSFLRPAFRDRLERWRASSNVPAAAPER